MRYTIYLIRCPNGKPAYIGCTCRDHKARFKEHGQYGRVFKKYGSRLPGCTVEVLKWTRSVIKADRYERVFIAKLRPSINYDPRTHFHYINPNRAIGDPRNPIANLKAKWLGSYSAYAVATVLEEAAKSELE